MKTITVRNFHAGIADDIQSGNIGEFSIAKHFDILSNPKKLQPLRGMTAESVTNTLIGNIILASDGLMYAVGEDPLNPGSSGKLWQRSGYGALDVYQSIPTNNQLSGAVMKYPFLVEYKDCGNTKSIFWASNNLLVASDPLGATSATTDALTFTEIGAGYVHPKDRILYFPYKTSTATFVGTISPNATPFASKAYTAFTLPKQYTVPCLTNYGNYLAIPAYSGSGSGVNTSIVYLSNRDTSLTTFEESIAWGAGQLKVLNNLEGTLIGVSTLSANYSGSTQDSDSIFIKGYNGGSEPFIIKEIKARHLVSSGGGSQPSVAINPNVNFVYKNRLYFSVNIVPNDGISNSYYGLWSVGRNKVTGQYTVTMERMATNTNTETGVLAAAISGDFVSMVHTTAGTMTYTINGTASTATYGATSTYESLINPEMTEEHSILNKQLHAVAVHCEPLVSGQQIIMYYRVDSIGSWLPCFTKTSTSPDTKLTAYESSKPTTGQFKAGRNFEFKLESTGGAVILGFSYKYSVLKTQID